MRNVKVLFFAADPVFGRPDGVPLELADEMREIEYHVKQARFGGRLQIEPHGAARADDLLDLLEHTDARVVHFSGHGGRHGLHLVARDGRNVHQVDAAALKQVFGAYHGSVRLVVLSACSSDQEAQAIADIVGCAIGTPSTISDTAAITFNSRFYRAIANGYSVQRAFDNARMALQVYRIPKEEYPELFRGNGADPNDVVLVRAHRIVPHRAVLAGASCLLTAAMVNRPPNVHPELTVSDIACSSDATPTGVRPLMNPEGAASTTPAAPAGPAAHLATAKAFYRGRNYAAARSAFADAADAGNGEAMGCLGYMYLYGRGMAPQPLTGFELVHTAATDERDPHAMHALGNAYLAGVGTTARPHLAEYWFKEAAKLDYAEAMRSLGDLSRTRMNDSSHREALVWYQKAVDSGSIDARVDIGMMYEFGWGLQRDHGKALEWYRSAAAAGSPRGAWAVGQSYQKGVGVAPDYDEAMLWYERAAQAGSANAMNSIGVLYENGLGVGKSRWKAYRWYKRAEKAGSPLARGNLGNFGRD